MPDQVNGRAFLFLWETNPLFHASRTTDLVTRR